MKAIHYQLKKRHRFVLDLTYDLKTEFKAAAAIRGEDMGHIVLRFIKAYVGSERQELNRLIDVYRDKGIEE